VYVYLRFEFFDLIQPKLFGKWLTFEIFSGKIHPQD
jgi:hypothetical protein